MPVVTATVRSLPPTGSVSSTVQRVLRAKAEHAWRYGWSYRKYIEAVAEDRSLDLHGGATEEASSDAWTEVAAEWAHSAKSYDPAMAREATRRRLLTMIETDPDTRVRVMAERLLAKVQPGVLAPTEVKTEHSGSVGGGVDTQIVNVLAVMGEEKLRQIVTDYKTPPALTPKK